MHRALNASQNLFGRVLGDPSHRTHCIFCPASIPIQTRIDAAIMLQIFARSHVTPCGNMVSSAIKLLLCEECKSDRKRVVEYGCHVKHMLLVHARSKGKQLWPTSLSGFVDAPDLPHGVLFGSSFDISPHTVPTRNAQSNQRNADDLCSGIF